MPQKNNVTAEHIASVGPRGGEYYDLFEYTDESENFWYILKTEHSEEYLEDMVKKVQALNAEWGLKEEDDEEIKESHRYSYTYLNVLGTMDNTMYFKTPDKYNEAFGMMWIVTDYVDLPCDTVFCMHSYKPIVYKRDENGNFKPYRINSDKDLEPEIQNMCDNYNALLDKQEAEARGK